MWFLLLLVSSVYAGSCTSKFSQSDKDVILAAHNKLRSSIAMGQYSALGKTFPAASNMEQMVWNCDVENSAQTWANGCQFVHSGSKTYGENLYMYWSWQAVKTSDVTQASCDSWSTEFQQHGLNSTTMTWDQFSAGIGHATQMAWATSSQLGCGVALCGDGNKQALVVCQYKQQGNMIGSPIYLEGAACSKCPTYAPTCDTARGLCITGNATVSPPAATVSPSATVPTPAVINCSNPK